MIYIWLYWLIFGHWDILGNMLFVCGYIWSVFGNVCTYLSMFGNIWLMVGYVWGIVGYMW